MPAKRIVVHDAVVLKISPSGESYLRVNLLAPQNGVFSLLKRLSRKRADGQLDLFDECEASIDLKSGERHNEGFLHEFSVTSKRSGIGKSYTLLKAAAWISELFLLNPIHEENDQTSYDLARKALNALNAGHPPDAIRLKTLFTFCRSEGYPMQEDWARKLDTGFAPIVIQILNTSLDSLSFEAKTLASAFETLQAYVQHNTHIRLPKP